MPPFAGGAPAVRPAPAFAGPLRVAPWPDDKGNPYQKRFYDALAPYGVRSVQELLISDEALLRLQDQVDVVHLHWPEYAWRLGDSSAATQVRRIVGLVRFLRLARRLGKRIWWTAHNIEPHEGHRLVNYLGYRAVAACADLVIAHSRHAAMGVCRRYGRRLPIAVMPQGNYDDVYPVPRPGHVVLTELGLDPGIPMVAAVGAIRRYKGIEVAIEAVRRLQGRVQLVIAGNPKPDVDVQRLRDLADAPFVRFVERSLSDQEFADFTNASQAVLLPYRRATTSAVLLTAWSLGRGVVASDLPCFADELETAPEAGRVARVDDAGGFASAISEYLAVPEAVRQVAALEAAAARTWAESARQLVAQMRFDWLSGQPTR